MRIIPIILFLAVLGCKSSEKNGNENPNTIPVWVQERIINIEQSELQNPPAEIHEYLYNGGRVFYFNAPCCDQFTQLFDLEGKLLCAPDGGITGKGDYKCPDFKEKAEYIKEVWTDPRANKEE